MIRYGLGVREVWAGSGCLGMVRPAGTVRTWARLATLGVALDGAAVGVASVALLEGPPEVGKSALLRAVAGDAEFGQKADRRCLYSIKHSRTG